MMHKLFASNLRLLQKNDPKLALQISYNDPGDLLFCTTEAGELNLKRAHQGKTYYYHKQEGAFKEAEDWFAGLHLGDAGVLYLYGLGLGYYYEAVKEWLRASPDHLLVFLEDDLGVMRRFMETEIAAALLRDSQVKIAASNSLPSEKEAFDDLAWDYIQLPYTFSCLHLYEEVKSRTFLQLKHMISYENSLRSSFVGEYLDYGIPFFRNFYANLYLIQSSFSGNSLFGKFKEIPAIICGAGPSLDRNKHLLPELADKALIFAGGSALNVLAASGIEPHFGAGVDPNPVQYDRIRENQRFHTPFFYRARLNHQALLAVKGPKLYLTGSGGYGIAEWVESELGIEGEQLDEGHNIVNFSLSIARALGCNPVIFVGVDLAYTDMQAYASGVVESPAVFEDRISCKQDLDLQAVRRKDIFGKPVYTLWKWAAESEWIAEYAREYPKARLVNATEGGIGFDGIPNMSLQEAAAVFMKKSYPLKEKIAAEIKRHPLSFAKKDKVSAVLFKLQESLLRAQKYLEKLMAEAASPVGAESPRAAILEMDLTEEPAYAHLLDTFNMVYLKLNQRAIRGSALSKNRDARQKKLELHRKRLQFLKEVVEVNLALLIDEIS